MAISIRNSRAEQLVREVAELSQESMTQAIIHSLEDRLLHIKGRCAATDTAEKIMNISRRCGSLPDVDRRTADEILVYDHIGVPN